jgi:hypothetical protein
VLAAPPLSDQVVAVIDEQLQLPQQRLLRVRPVEARLAERSARDRQGVDRIGLAAAATAATLRSGQPRRHPDEALALLKQRLFETPCDVPAILDRPRPLSIQLPRPGRHLIRARAVPLTEPAAELVDGDRRQRVIVYVQTNNDH